MRAQRPDYHLCIGEAVDNAFDAGASKVDVVFNHNKIVVRDNGRGMTRDKIASIAILGAHAPTPTTRLGRFGVGIKLQALICGDVLEVETSSKDGLGSLRINWQRMIDDEDWEIDDPEWREIVAGETGSLVTIKDLRREPTKSHIQRARDELIIRFHPALISGRGITFNGDKLLPAIDPAITDVVEETIWVRGGKGAKVRAGILVDKKAPIYQTQVSFEHRVIIPKSTFGCGEWGGTRSMFARVDLVGPWELAKFKDDLPDKDAKALEDAVEALLTPILDKCRVESVGAAVREMEERLNDLLPPEMAAVRPQKKKEASAAKEKDEKKNKRGEAPDAPESKTGPARALDASQMKRPHRRHTKCPKGFLAYRQLWRIVDGAVADALSAHPDYLTPKGQRSAQLSITKRVTGAVLGFAAEAARAGLVASPAADKGAELHLPASGDGFTRDHRRPPPRKWWGLPLSWWWPR
jgi:hypothetical protein